MELTRFDIIKRPLITTKSVDLYKKLGQYTFEIHQSANKTMVKDAVERLWEVKVDKVRVIRIAGKQKSFNRRPYQGSGIKKAVITLRQGFKIEIPGLFEEMTAESAPKQQVAEGS